MHATKDRKHHSRRLQFRSRIPHPRSLHQSNLNPTRRPRQSRASIPRSRIRNRRTPATHDYQQKLLREEKKEHRILDDERSRIVITYPILNSTAAKCTSNQLA